MKRSACRLVDYDSEDSSLSDNLPSLDETGPVDKLKLPADFDDLYAVDARRGDDPVFHGGRRRQVRHVAGVYASHLFLPIPSLPDLRPILDDAGGRWESLLRSEFGLPRELHVSLSRSIFLSRAERDVFRLNVRHVRSPPPFEISIDRVKAFTNDDESRCFLVLGLKSCASLDRLGQVLQRIPGLEDSIITQDHHISIAWASAAPPVDLDLLNQKHAATLQGITIDVTRFKLKIGNSVESVDLTGL